MSRNKIHKVDASELGGLLHMKSIAICEAPDGSGQCLIGVGEDGIVYKYVYEAAGLELHYCWKPLRMRTKLGPEPQLL